MDMLAEEAYISVYGSTSVASFRILRFGAAPGVGGQTAAEVGKGKSVEFRFALSLPRA